MTKIVVPDDFPLVFAGSEAEAQLRELGDVTTLLDPTVTDAIRGRMSEGGSEEKEG